MRQLLNLVVETLRPKGYQMFQRRIPKDFWQKLREWVWPVAGWSRVLKYLIQRLVRLDDGPHRVAVGMSCGAFVSANPFIGTHFLQAALLALLFRGNIIAATIGTWVGNPLSLPLIWVSTYKVGILLLGGDQENFVELNLSLFLDAPYKTLIPLIKPMLIGSLPVGLVLGIATYFPSLWMVRGYKIAMQKRRAKKRIEVKTGADEV